MWGAVKCAAESISKLRGYFDIAWPGWQDSLNYKPTHGPDLVALESATLQAAALIDLLMSKIVEEDRAGRIEYHQSQWVGDLSSLAIQVQVNLRDTFYAYHKSLRRE